jgi:hypothetical protein
MQIEKTPDLCFRCEADEKVFFPPWSLSLKPQIKSESLRTRTLTTQGGGCNGTAQIIRTQVQKQSLEQLNSRTYNSGSPMKSRGISNQPIYKPRS